MPLFCVEARGQQAGICSPFSSMWVPGFQLQVPRFVGCSSPLSHLPNFACVAVTLKKTVLCHPWLRPYLSQTCIMDPLSKITTPDPQHHDVQGKSLQTLLNRKGHFMGTSLFLLLSQKVQTPDTQPGISSYPRWNFLQVLQVPFT